MVQSSEAIGDIENGPLEQLKNILETRAPGFRKRRRMFVQECKVTSELLKRGDQLNVRKIS
jgi:hypothetical protein